MKEKYNFIFPSFLARRMERVNPRNSLIINVFAVVGILFSMTFLVIYRTVTMTNGFFIETFIILNLIAGWVLLSGSAIATYKQYLTLKEFER